MKVTIRFMLIALLITACTTQRSIVVADVNAIRFVGQFSVPHKTQYRGTTIGGLSGIDYSLKENLFYLIADDRSDINPIRFYKARMGFSAKGIESVQFEAVHFLSDRGSDTFPSRRVRPVGIPDPEAIRLHPSQKFLAWCSEGERLVRKTDTLLTHPAVFFSTTNWQWLDSLPVPDNFKMTTVEKGPRNNGVFEGLSFSPDGKKMFIATEEPLYDDGPRAGLYDSVGLVRILQYDMASKKPEVQFAYKIDPVVQEPISQSLFFVNGITDILSINNHQLLVTERSFSTGRLGNNVRLYLVDLTKASDVSSITALDKNAEIKLLPKKLLLDLDRLGILVDNIEGVTFGPRLPNGKQSLIMVADDNFSPKQKTQFLLFEVN